MIKNDKKMAFKNDALLYHFLNDKNSVQIISPGQKKLIRLHVLKRE